MKARKGEEDGIPVRQAFLPHTNEMKLFRDFALSPFRVPYLDLVGGSRKDEKAKGRMGEWERDVAHQFDELSGRIIEAAIAVHKALGPGFLESIYDSAIRTALRHRGIVYESQKEIAIFFEGEEAGVHRLDLIVEAQVVVELKAIKALEDIHFAQVKSYLKATGLHVGLLLNFNAPTLVVKRVVLDFRTGDDDSV